MRRKHIAAVITLLVAAGSYIYSSTDIFNIRGSPGINVTPPSELSSIDRPGIKPEGYINALITRIVDGDTVEIAYSGKEYIVRLLDVDTPESVKRGVPVQPFSKEASAYVSNRALNRKARLIFEKDTKDRYGRLLAHILLPDGSYLNGLLVRNGYARVEIVKPNTRLEDYFLSLQAEAISRQNGLWALKKDMRPFIPDKDGNYVPKYWK